MALVVAGFPVGDADLGVEQGEPLIHVQAFLADSVVERLDEPVPPWLTWRDVTDPDVALAESLQRFRDEFWAVVATDQYWLATSSNNRFESCNQVVAGDRPGGDVKQRFSGVFINH